MTPEEFISKWKGERTQRTLGRGSVGTKPIPENLDAVRTVNLAHKAGTNCTL
jgi:hypothetical protein